MLVNNGTSYQKNLEGANKHKLAREISRRARANCYAGNEYHWYVWDDQGKIVVAGAGTKNANGNFVYLDCDDLNGQPI